MGIAKPPSKPEGMRETGPNAPPVLGNPALPTLGGGNEPPPPAPPPTPGTGAP